MLKQLIPMQLTYIACLGPKKRLDRMLDELREEGMNITDEQLAGIYGPAGLDVGAETSDEIALSILSEMQAVLKKRDGSSLRERKFIHNRKMDEIIQQDRPAVVIKSC